MATLADIIRDVKPLLMPTVKVAARLSTDAFDLEIEAAVEGAIADLKRVGIAEACFDSRSDYYPLIRQAVVMYCKAHFGQDNPNEEMRFWIDSYQMHLDALLNSGANAYAMEDIVLADEVEEPVEEPPEEPSDDPSEPDGEEGGEPAEVDPNALG